MLGSPTVVADFTLPGDTSQVAARLLDVAPDGQETLVSRGLWRPATGGPDEAGVPAHPNGWQFAEGHVPKLELLPKDTDPGLTGGYGRASDDQQPVTVSNLELRLPVVERPGSQDGLVKQPAPRVLPDGYELAADFAGAARPAPDPRADEAQAQGAEAVRQRRMPDRVGVVQRRQGQGHDEGAGRGQEAEQGRLTHLQVRRQPATSARSG